MTTANSPSPARPFSPSANSPSQITVLIADDHPIFRGGLRAVIEKDPSLTVVAEADNGAAALALIKEHQPQVAVLDLDMPELDGFGVTRELRKAHLPTSVVILSLYKDEMHFNEAVDLGVRGYVIKDGAVAEVVNCIKSVAAGKEYFSPELSSFMIKRVRGVSSFAQQAGINELTPTERRVLYLLAELKTSKQIAAELGISTRTVENHRSRICSKLSLQGSHALTKFAMQHKEKLS